MRSLVRGPEGQVPETAVDRPAQNLTFIPCPDFDLALTLRSGQAFRWREEAPSVFSGWIGGSHTRVSQEEDRLRLEGVSPESARHFFSLDVDLPAITCGFGADPVIRGALGCYPGLRVLRQDPWECVASFLLSAYNNIPRLTGMLETLAGRFGVPDAGPAACGYSRRPSSRFALRAGRRVLPPASPASFPRPEALAEVSERVLRNCGLGYRAPYLKMVAEKIARGKVDLEKLSGLEDEALREKLLALPGIGEKVVECVMLFGFGRGSAFPVDVWIGRSMREWYFRRRKVSDRKIREFARRRFGPHCGWAQQYLFCFARWQPRLSPV